MSGKQKAWRLKAEKVKAAIVAKGEHVKGSRYGRTIKAIMAAGKFKAAPSHLFQVIGINAGVLRGPDASA